MHLTFPLFSQSLGFVPSTSTASEVVAFEYLLSKAYSVIMKSFTFPHMHRPGGQDGGGSRGPWPVRAAALLRPRLAPQPFNLAECGGTRGLRHHALGRHGGREDPAAGGFTNELEASS